MRLPQGPWFPWSREFRWDRWPWQGTKRHERESIRDQRDLAALVEAASTTIGVVARQAGFTFRPDACHVDRLNDGREAAVLYEAAPNEVTDQLRAFEHESCVDLWIYWSPDTGRLSLSLPGTLRSGRPQHVDRGGLRAALEAQARELEEQPTPDE